MDGAEQILDRSLNMEMYLFEQTADLYSMYQDRLKDEILHGGHVDMRSYIQLLEAMEPEKMKDWERRMWGEISELRAIKDDIMALQNQVWDVQTENQIPDWFISEDMRREAI